MFTFELTIQRKHEQHWPVVVRYQAGPTALTIWESGIFDLDLDQLELLLPSQTEFGVLLGRNLFRDEVRDAFARAVSEAKAAAELLRVLLIVEADELRPLHWEQLCAPFEGGRWDYLLLNQQTPFSLYLPSQIERRFPPIGRRDLRALLLVAGPEELENDYGLVSFDVPATVTSLHTALGEIPCDVLASQIEGPFGDPTLDALCKCLTVKRYTLLHIVCHGVYKKDNDETILFFPRGEQRRPVTGTELIKRLNRLDPVHGLPHFTFLSTCESADPRAESGLGGIGQRLVRELGMPAVLAMTDRVSIQTAQALAEAFYARMTEHGEVDRALAEALVGLHGRYDITVPALISRLGGRPLFSDTLDRPLTESEIRFGLEQALPLITQRAPIQLPDFEDHAFKVQATLGPQAKALSTEARRERETALNSINQMCSQALDLSFNALALGQKPPEYDDRCSFRGLYPFRLEDREFFFGREPLVEKLVARLNGGNFLAILGPSGCGKSSLVTAGLVPKLGKPIAYLTPGSTPLSQLEAVLQSSDPSSILIVDQFEELFTLCSVEPERQGFLERLLELTRNMPVVITMRADFWGDCARYLDFKEMMQTHQELIAPMSTSEMRQAMELQASAVGLRFEADLSNTILEAVEGEPGAMPLLQHLLKELWDRRCGRWLRASAYRTIGGIQKAIAYTADEHYEALQPSEQILVQNLFIRLTRLGQEADRGQVYRDTRQRVPIIDLIPAGQNPEVINKLVHRLADARLVVTSVRYDTGETEVEVAHEALIQYWPRLRAWLEEDRASIHLREGLSHAAREWQALERDPGALYRGARLAHVSEWAEQHYAELTILEREFISSSQELEKREEIARETQRQRELKLAQEKAEAEHRRAEEQIRARRSLQKFTLGLAIIFLIAVAAAGIAIYQRGIAIEQEQIALSQRLVAQAQNVLSQGNQHQLGMLLALEAQKRYPSPQSEEVLRAGLSRLPFHLASMMHQGYVNALAFRPDGLQFASAADDGVRIWEAQDGAEVLNIPTETEALSVAYRPNGKWLITGEYRQVIVWDADSGEEITRLKHRDWVTYVGFSPNGEWLASASADGSVRVWRTSNLSEVAASYRHRDLINQLIFSPRKGWLASASDDGSILVWDVVTNKEVSHIQLQGLALSLAFNSDGGLLATGSSDATARVWKLLPSGEVSEILRLEHTNWVESVTFSPDDTRLATASDDSTARIWDLESGNEIIRMLHNGWVTIAAFSPDGKWLATGSGSESNSDFTARLWDTTNGQEVSQMPHRDSVTAVNFSPDGARLVTADRSGLVQLWDIAAIARMEFARIVQKDLVRDVAFDKKGNWLATTSDDGFTAWIWNPSTEENIARLPRNNSKFVRAVAISPQGSWLAAASDDRTVWLWDISAGLQVGESIERNVLRLPHDGAVNTVAFSPDGKLLASGGEDFIARLWDLNTQQELLLVEHEDKVSAVAFSPDGGQLATAGEDGVFILSDTDSGQELLVKKTEYLLRDIVFSPDGKIVATAADRFVFLWNVANGKQILQMVNDGEVQGIAFSPGGEYLASTSDDGSTRVWDVAKGQELGRILHSGISLSVAFSPDGAWLAATNGNAVYIWDMEHLPLISTNKIVTEICRRLSRNLTMDEWKLYFGSEPYQKTCPELS